MTTNNSLLAADNFQASDPEKALLRQVITLGMLIKILLGVGGLLITIGVYEVNQLDKLREQAGSLQATVSGLQSKVENTQAKLDSIQKQADKSGDKMDEVLKIVQDLKIKVVEREQLTWTK
jgi:peptidoglycan hydrolase CwlO-like protein